MSKLFLQRMMNVFVCVICFSLHCIIETDLQESSPGAESQASCQRLFRGWMKQNSFLIYLAGRIPLMQNFVGSSVLILTTFTKCRTLPYSHPRIYLPLNVGAITDAVLGFA